MQKPVFNVPPVFQTVVVCTMNKPMARLLSDLIHEVDGKMEKELVAFGRRLYTVTACENSDTACENSNHDG